jgi:hypothetical protein
MAAARCFSTSTYYPGTTEVPEASAANVHGVSYKVLAEVELTAESEGVVFAQGSRFGGHAMTPLNCLGIRGLLHNREAGRRDGRQRMLGRIND